MARAAALLHRRPRPSTLILLAIFGGILALYVIVRPDTVTTGGGSPAPLSTVAPSPSESASPSRSATPGPSPSETAAPTPTPTRSPKPSSSPTPSSAVPLPGVTTAGRR